MLHPDTTFGNEKLTCPLSPLAWEHCEYFVRKVFRGVLVAKFWSTYAQCILIFYCQCQQRRPIGLPILPRQLAS